MALKKITPKGFEKPRVQTPAEKSTAEAPEAAAPGRRVKPAPEWATETPCPASYDISMYDTGGEEVQVIPMTRSEFIAIKRYLAEIRGFAVPVDIDDPHGDLIPDRG